MSDGFINPKGGALTLETLQKSWCELAGKMPAISLATMLWVEIKEVFYPFRVKNWKAFEQFGIRGPALCVSPEFEARLRNEFTLVQWDSLMGVRVLRFNEHERLQIGLEAVKDHFSQTEPQEK
jgi:hypothetical protein